MIRRIGIVQVIGRTLSPSARAFYRVLGGIDVSSMVAADA